MKNILIAFGIVMFTLFILSFVFKSVEADPVDRSRIHASLTITEELET